MYMYDIWCQYISANKNFIRKKNLIWKVSGDLKNKVYFVIGISVRSIITFEHEKQIA